MIHARILKYRELLSNSLNKSICVTYKRTKHHIHTFHGKIVKVRKSSLKLMINDEEIVSIGFRNIKDVEFLTDKKLTE